MDKNRHNIGRVCVNPPGKDTNQDKNREWVEVIIDKTGTIGGHVLQHLANPRTSREYWREYFSFPANAKHPPGALVRIHSGGGRPNYDSKGVFHYYVAGEDGSGRWWFNNDGDIIRLLNPVGDEVARRELQGHECEAESVDTGGGKPAVAPPLVTPARSYAS